jgi:hypothetical protein
MSLASEDKTPFWALDEAVCDSCGEYNVLADEEEILRRLLALTLERPTRWKTNRDPETSRRYFNLDRVRALARVWTPGHSIL